MFGFSIVAIIIVGVSYVFGVPRLFKTIYLIARVTPFERSIPGAPVIVVLGDSTGYGTGASKSAQTIAGRIGTEFPTYSIINKSKNGRTIGELQQVMETDTTMPAATVILLQIGGNDILQKHRVEEVAIQLRTVFALAFKKSNQVVMMSSGNVGTAAAYTGTPEATEYDTLSRSYREMFMTEAKNAGVTYIDLFHEPTEDVFYLEPEVYLAIDGLHPSDAGYGVWYAALQPIVRKILSIL